MSDFLIFEIQCGFFMVIYFFLIQTKRHPLINDVGSAFFLSER